MSNVKKTHPVELTCRACGQPSGARINLAALARLRVETIAATCRRCLGLR